MGAVKDGYGPKEPTGIRGAKPAPERSKMDHGFRGNPALVRAAANTALSASADLRRARANGQGHPEQESFNTAMASLQQHDSLAHASVLAIHHLESLVATGQESKHTRSQLKQAHSNLRARLANGGQRN